MLEARAARNVVAELHEFGPRLDAANNGAQAERVVEVVVDGEGQIALARPHVHGGNLFPARERRRLVELADRLDEAVNLPQLVAHRRSHRAVLVRHAEGLKVDVAGDLNGAALAPVVLGVGRRFEGRRPAEEARLAPSVELQPQVFGGREEVAASELRAEQSAYKVDALFGRVVSRHIPRLVPVEEGEARARFERDGADVEVPQVRLAAARLGEREADEGAAGDALFERVEELLRVRLGHAPILKQRIAARRPRARLANVEHLRYLVETFPRELA